MREMILVALGGFFGAISRFALSKQIQGRNKTSFPLGTLSVNLIGAFLLGLISGMQINSRLIALLGIGFMGALTTFSTLNLESEQIRKEKKYPIFYGYLFLSYFLGIILAFCGLLIGRRI
ncbi:fluoride efflux transporter CrcB [Neobacillus sp.]|uniref:fluoride efflux transporter CrcB n=1 Tax=Neobacillus sp. TaxID=2675273 RepID=UPI00289F66BD|nr:fluoride efflux transporter CrcB [Neobacillus sp.]